MLPCSDACERNKEPILTVLRDAFAGCRTVLEIGSGTGQHAVHFARALPQLVWHPTERAEHLRDLETRVRQTPLPNLLSPLELDVTQKVWPLARVDAVFSANTLHIMSWAAVITLFAGAGRVLAPAGRMAIYGPFNVDGRYTAPGNERFDAQLRRRDPASGIRDLADVTGLAGIHGLSLTSNHEMPANNRLLVFGRVA